MTSPTHEQQTKALNQLASLLAGRDAAVVTNALAHDPIARIEQLISISTTRLRRAAACGDQGEIKGTSRTIESLGSLLILAESLVVVEA
jgi:hypothetical protein